jgi:disulfide bond formation protein DsbB
MIDSIYLYSSIVYYKFYFISGIITSTNNNNILLYVIVIPLLTLGLILFLIFCLRHRHHRKTPHPHHSHRTDNLKSLIKPRQPLIHHNGAMIPSTISCTSNDYLAESVDSLPVPRQYQQQRYGPSTSSDLASLTSSNLYYARVQAI